MATKIRLIDLRREAAYRPFRCDYCLCNQKEKDPIIIRASLIDDMPIAHTFCSMDCHDEWETENYGTLYGI